MTAPVVHRDTPVGWTGPAGDYDRWFDEPWGRYAFAVEAATVLRAAGALEGTRLLDAGCGTGRLGIALERRGSLLVGVDPDEGMLAIARSRLASRCVRGVSEGLPFPAETFDLTVAVTVLEFVTDPAAAAAELARVTRPGGRIVIGALNPRSPWGLANHRRLRSGVWCHARFINRAELRSLAAPHGASTLYAGLFAPGAFPALRVLGPALEALGTIAPALGAFQVIAIDKPPPMASPLPGSHRVLVVCAHPDDESFGLGGVLHTLADSGSRLSVLCFTHGEASTLHGVDGDLAIIRAEELDAAGRRLGVEWVELLDYPDGALAAQARSELAGHVRRVAHETGATILLVFDHGGITGHPDHQAATDAALSAAATLDVPVYAWVIPSSVADGLNREFGTSFVGRAPDRSHIVLTVDRPAQADAIDCHRSQATDNPVLRRRLELMTDQEWLHRLR